MDEEQKIDTDFVDASPKNKSSLTILIVSIVIILLVLLGVKFLYLDNPSRVFINSLNTLKSDITNNIKNIKNYNGNDIKVNLETLGVLRDYDLNDISKYTFKINTLINKKEKEGYISLIFKDGLPDSKGINADITYKDYKVYGNIKDIYENGKLVNPTDDTNKKALKVFDKDAEKDSDRINYIIDKSFTLLKPSISKDKFSKKSITVSINGKNTKLTDYTYTLDKQEIEKVKANVLIGLINDDASITYISLLTSTETVNVKDYLRKISNKDIKENTKVVLHVYTKGLTNETIGYGIDATNFDSIRFYKIKNDIEFEISNKLKVSGTFDAGSKINVLLGDKLDRKMTINVREKTTEELDLGFTIEKNSKGKSYSGDINLRNVGNEKETNLLFSFNLERVEDGFTSTIKLDIDATLKDSVEIKLDKDKYEETYWSVLKNDLEYYKEIPLVDKLITQIKNKKVGN